MNKYIYIYNKLKQKKETQSYEQPNIELVNNLNKTIIHVLDYSNGFGDFLRGTILLLQYADKYKSNFKMNVSNHYINKFLEDESIQSLDVKPQLVLFKCGKINSIEHSNNIVIPIIDNFIKSTDENLYITTNHFYDKTLITENIKNYINSFFKFKQIYYDKANKLIKLDKYKVLHIRCNDIYFNKEFNSDKLLIEIIKLQLDYNTIVISNNYSIKKKLNELFGFQYIDNISIHTGNIANEKVRSLISHEYLNETNFNELESTIIDYIILSKSEYTYCFSFYGWGSGFSEHCSILNDIPYKMVYLETESIFKINKVVTNECIEDYKLLLNHYNHLLNFPIKSNEKMKIIGTYDDISFITLTNTEYIDYTLNCLESLKRINAKINLECYCIGIDGYNKLKNKGILCNLINDEQFSKLETHQVENWSNITYYKFEIIYEKLLKNKYVCFTDGDIVYENNDIFDFLLQNIGNNDMLIQSEGLYIDELCSGFIFIKSNELTLSIFNPKNIQSFKKDDQMYVNNNKYKMKYIKLPLTLFPTEKYYYKYGNNIKPYMIHFNWVKGHEKKQKMIEYNKWFNRVKICQYGTDGFGHQLEGMLRLLSLSINDKADYQYNYKRTYQFEHSNFKIQKLISYISCALKYLSKNICHNEKKQEQSLNICHNEKEQTLNICHNEQRIFSQIITNDLDYENNIYFYDGISCSIPEKLPPNFESKIEIEKSIPQLREAFVIKNNHLPNPSYDNNYINVCCHVILGDALGRHILDNEKIYEVIKYFQRKDKYRVIIHTDDDLNNLKTNNTIIYDSKIDVLQVLSDFIYADILIINYSSISIAAHLLGNKDQKVICPSNTGSTFKDRVLTKCITCNDFLNQNIIN
jgi:hypothetical protein